MLGNWALKGKGSYPINRHAVLLMKHVKITRWEHAWRKRTHVRSMVRFHLLPLNLRKMIAINPKNQTIVNRCLKALDRYNELNDKRNDADDNGDMREYRKLDKKCEDAFDRYLTFLWALPKNQQIQINKIL